MAAQIGVTTRHIAPDSPWANGCDGSFNRSLRDELLNGEIFYSLAEAKILIAAWRRRYNISPPQQPGLSPADTGSRCIASAALRLRFAQPSGQHWREGDNARTISTDHAMGAGHEAKSIVYWEGNGAVARATDVRVASPMRLPLAIDNHS